MSYKDTIGFRTNNYGNIKYNASNKWVGQTGFLESAKGVKFAKFSDPVYGVRAIFGLLKTYIGRQEDTIKKIIDRYAPVGDGTNNPSRYAENVAKWSGVGVSERLKTTDKAKLIKIVQAIIRQEIGYEVSVDLVENAYNMLFDVNNTVLTASNEMPQREIIKSKTSFNEIIMYLLFAVVIIVYILLRKNQ